MKPRPLPQILCIPLLSVVALCISACSTVHSPEPDLVRPDTPPLPAPVVKFRVGFMPLVVEDEFTQRAESTNSAPEGRQRVFVPTPEFRRQFIEELVAAYRQVGVFADVEFLPSADGRKLDAVLAEAWDDGLDLVARPELRRQDCTHVGQNGSYVPNLILFLFTLPFFTWGIADETFSSETVMELQFFSTAGSGSAPAFTREVRGAVTHELDDFNQGFNLLNLFITPSGMSDGQWNDIGNCLLPLSRQACQREALAAGMAPESGLAGDVANALPRLQKSMAIVFGTREPGGQYPRFAVNDVKAVADFLGHAEPEPVVAAHALAAIEGNRATRTELLAAIDELFVTHGREGDRALLALVAEGAIDSKGNAYLLLADTDPADIIGTALPVAELAAALEKLPMTVAVIAAMSWRPVDPASPAREFAPFRALAALPNVAVLAARTDAQPAIELESLPGSLFVSEFLKCVRDTESADANADGWLSLREIHRVIAPPITEFSTMDGNPQPPTLIGAAADQPMIAVRGTASRSSTSRIENRPLPASTATSPSR